MFWKRLASGIVLVIVAVLTIMAGGDVWFLLVSLLSMIGLYELYKTMNIEKTWIGYAGFLAAAFYAILLRWNIQSSSIVALIAGFFLISGIYVFTFPKYKATQVAFSVFGMVYVPLLMMHLYQVRELGDGLYIIPLVFLSAWGNDTCAYCVGMLIGKHKMSPKLSPKKSVEGLVGGIVGAGILGAAYGTFFGAKLPSLGNAAVSCAIICSVGAVIAVIGDLAASAIKRDTGIKDYGKLIPGHGGVLDRFDSILFTAPIVYYLALYLGAIR